MMSNAAGLGRQRTGFVETHQCIAMQAGYVMKPRPPQ